MVINFIRNFFNELIVLFEEMAPYLLLGLLFAGLLNVFFPKKLVRKYIGGSDLRSVVNASLLGVPMPLCSCGVLPAGIGFYKSGASRGATVSFLVSTPQTGVDSIIATYAMLGLPMAVLRPVIALISGIFGGVLTNRLSGSKGNTTYSDDLEDKSDRSFLGMLRYGFVEMIQDISKWLLIGFVIAALLAVAIPSDFFVETISNEYLSMLLILVASIPLYVCATGSIPIAAVLLLKGLSPGAAIVFLMAGPATNAATMAVINNSMGKRTFWLYLISIVGGALFFGIVVNELIPREWVMGHLPAFTHEMHQHGESSWIKIVSAIILVLLMINAYVQSILSRRKQKKESSEFKTIKEMKIYSVGGMTCNHCKAAVEKGIAELDNKSDIFADPQSNELRVVSENISDEDVKKCVESLGYTYKGLK